jgi:hypothetical protein
LCVILTVFVFFTKDNYNQLGLSFSSILIVSVVSVEAKDDFPDFWIRTSWIDMFVIGNVSALVTAPECG